MEVQWPTYLWGGTKMPYSNFLTPQVGTRDLCWPKEHSGLCSHWGKGGEGQFWVGQDPDTSCIKRATICSKELTTYQTMISTWLAFGAIVWTFFLPRGKSPLIIQLSKFSIWTQSQLMLMKMSGRPLLELVWGDLPASVHFEQRSPNVHIWKVLLPIHLILQELPITIYCLPWNWLSLITLWQSCSEGQIILAAPGRWINELSASGAVRGACYYSKKFPEIVPPWRWLI